MTRTGTLVYSRCAVLAMLVGWTGLALAQSSATNPRANARWEQASSSDLEPSYRRADSSDSTWQASRSPAAPSQTKSAGRGTESPNRWMMPTRPSNRSAASTASSIDRTSKSASHQPRPFVPPTDAEQIATTRSNNQSAARTKTSNTHAQAATANRPTRTNANTSAARLSKSAAQTNGTAGKTADVAQRSLHTNSQLGRDQARPRPTNSNRLLDDSWIRPLKQAAFESSGPEELYAPPGHETEMPMSPGPNGPQFQSDGEWIGAPDGSPYGGPCCDGQCGPDSGCPDCGCADGVGPGCGDTCGSESHCSIDLGFGLHDPEACEEVRIRVPKVYTLMLEGGVQGFKGPLDQDRDSGNFGFQEGINMGFKVPLTGVGYQIGYLATQSQLSGDADTGIVDAFSQHFATAGVFRRNRDGFQGGIVWDFLLDERSSSIDFSQFRSELSFVDCGRHEVGGMITFHFTDQVFTETVNQVTTVTTFQPTDQFLLFYRMHGKRGGEGRVFAGITDDSDGIVGADFHLPLTDCWSLQPSFTYVMPEEGGGTIGARQEAWNIGINLVWHWKDQARSCHSSPYRPLFNVADNGWMIIDDRP